MDGEQSTVLARPITRWAPDKSAPAGRRRRVRFVGLTAVGAAILLAALTTSTDMPLSRHLAAAPPRQRTTTIPPTTHPSSTTTSSTAPSSTTAQAAVARTKATSLAPTTPAITADPPPVAPLANSTAAPTGSTLGPGCSDTTDFYAYDGPNGDRWHTGATGGCGTAFLYTALNVNTKDPNQWQEDAGWTFRNLPSASCTINVWIPASPYATATAHYWVSTGSQNYEDNIAAFTIDQGANHGRWYGVPITVSHPTLYVQIDDPGGTASGQFIAAGAVNLHC